MKHLNKAINDLEKLDTPVSRQLLAHVNEERKYKGYQNHGRIQKLVEEYVEITTKFLLSTQVTSLELDRRELSAIHLALHAYQVNQADQPKYTPWGEKNLSQPEKSSLISRIAVLLAE